MVCFMNHILYGLHLFTQKFEPVVYHNGKVSYNAMLAKKFFLLMLMNYLLCISYSFMSLINSIRICFHSFHFCLFFFPFFCSYICS